jgi:hypothetical protein
VAASTSLTPEQLRLRASIAANTQERARRAQHARKAYFQRLALASSKARAAKAGARRNGGGQGAA